MQNETTAITRDEPGELRTFMALWRNSDGANAGQFCFDTDNVDPKLWPSWVEYPDISQHPGCFGVLTVARSRFEAIANSLPWVTNSSQFVDAVTTDQL